MPLTNAATRREMVVHATSKGKGDVNTCPCGQTLVLYQTEVYGILAHLACGLGGTMYRICHACVAICLLVSPAFANVHGGALTSRAQIHEAYVDHPVVAEVRGSGYLTVAQRERALDKRTSADRALAIIDAVGAEGAVHHQVDKFITLGIQARLTIGPSGSMRTHDAAVVLLDARQALVLGWIRALTAGTDAKVLLRKSNLIEYAGAIQLLEIAATKEPQIQAHEVALAIAVATAQTDSKNACATAISLLRAARNGGKQSIRLQAAESVAALADPLQRKCTAAELAPFGKPIQLPAPVAEDAAVGATATYAAEARPRGNDATQYGVGFVMKSPFFMGYLTDVTVRKMADRTRLHALIMEDVLRRDTTGDVAVAVLNASILNGRIDLFDQAEETWLAILYRHNLHDAPMAKRMALKTAELTGPEAMALAYATALAGKGLRQATAGDAAFTASPQALFERAKGLVPATALLGPLMAQAHLVDLERQNSQCMAVKRAESLSFIVEKGALPEGAKTPLLQALSAVAGQCATAPAKQTN